MTFKVTSNCKIVISFCTSQIIFIIFGQFQLNCPDKNQPHMMSLHHWRSVARIYCGLAWIVTMVMNITIYDSYYK